MSVFARTPRPLLAAVATLALALLAQPSAATAQGSEGLATWRLEQPRPPQPPPGVPEATVPVGLGEIGDIEFFAPDRGLLITRGNPPTIPPGIWAYNGVEWHEIATVCGATDGRIAWAGPGEFWTVSDGRPGQASESGENINQVPPLANNTLCHFANGQVTASYAHPAFRADSYQEMFAAACFGPSDCWFAGERLQGSQIGAFQLHWNGGSLEAEPYTQEGHAIEDMRLFDGNIYESVKLRPGDRSSAQEQNPEPPVVHRIEPEGVLPPFEAEKLPFFEPTLDFLHLSAAGEEALWGAAGPQQAESGAPPVTVVVHPSQRGWSEIVGPASRSLGKRIFAEEAALFPEGAEHATVSALAAEPQSESAWIALTQKNTGANPGPAALVHVSAQGGVLEATTLPSAREQGEGISRKGTAAKLACPAPNDCWLATTQGWLFHLAPGGERTLPKDPGEAEYFKSLITFRPPDQGLPQVTPDAPPPDTSGLVEEVPNYGGTFAEASAPSPAALAKVALPLLSRLHSRLVHADTLELSFHLAVKARVRLVAKRQSKVVASTPDRTLKAGDHKLLLRLNPRRWPTKLNLQTRALAPLPLVSSVTGEGSQVTTETTGAFVLPRIPSLLGGWGSLP